MERARRWGSIPRSTPVLDLPFAAGDVVVRARVAIDRDAMHARLGPPGIRAADRASGDAATGWSLTFPCGLRVDLACTGHRDEAWMITNDADVEHALHHLGVRAEVVDAPATVATWTLRRYDDNGQHFEVDRYASERAARCAMDVYESRGHHQTYVAEPLADPR